MKRIFLHLTGVLAGLFFTAGNTSAQTVTIPDPDFKKALIYQGIDLNGDGEIQQTEARKVTRLYIDKAGIHSLIGIKSFTNLVEFGFYDNQIKVLDFEGMTHLGRIYGFNNQIESINIKGTGLEVLYLHQNRIRTLDVAGLTHLKELKMDKNALGQVDLSNLPALEEVILDNNMITAFKATGSPAIKKLNLNNNRLTALDLSAFKQLEVVKLDENPFLSSLNIRGLKQLRSLSCVPNSLSNLNLSGTVSLTELDF